MPMQAWTERRRARAFVNVRPPIAWLARDAWHVLMDRGGGRREMRWRPGIECWIDRSGRRVNAEAASDEGLSYLEPLAQAA